MKQLKETKGTKKKKKTSTTTTTTRQNKKQQHAFVLVLPQIPNIRLLLIEATKLYTIIHILHIICMCVCLRARYAVPLSDVTLQ